MSSEFYFSLLRITTAQIFRAAGIDRCNPSVLDTATDITMRHLLLLADTCTELAAASGRSQVNIVDLTEAMVNIGLIRPARLIDTSSADLFSELDEESDEEEVDELQRQAQQHVETNSQEIAGFIQFLDWAKGSIPADARVISRTPVAPASSLASASNAAVVPALSAPVGGAPVTASTDATSATLSITGTLPSSMAMTATDEPSAGTKAMSPPTPTSTAPIATEEWLSGLMRKQVKVGHENRFHGTVLAENEVLGDALASEFKIMGGPSSLEDAVQFIMESSKPGKGLVIETTTSA